jgi:hypothetical protein
MLYYQRPLPVVNIQIGYQGNNNTFISTSDVTFNWRETSSNGGAGTDGAGSREAGDFVSERDTFKIEVYNNFLTLVSSYTGITTIQWQYNYSSRVSDGINGDSFYLRIYQIKDNWNSKYKQFHAVSV